MYIQYLLSIKAERLAIKILVILQKCVLQITYSDLTYGGYIANYWPADRTPRYLLNNTNLSSYLLFSNYK